MSQPEPAESVDLFLCHSGADKPWVERLGAAIEKEKWGDRPLRVFLDKWDIPGGANIVLRLNQALEASRFVAVIMSPEMVGSDWCQAEWSSVLHLDPVNRSGRLLPVRRRDFHAQTGAAIRVPPFIASLAYFDFREDKAFRKELTRLLATLRGEAPPRGRADSRRDRPIERVVPALPPTREAPDRVPETLVSNLLPIRGLPAAIWNAPSRIEWKRDLPHGLPPCVIREGRLFTFTNLSRSEHAFSAFVAADGVKRTALMEWRQNRSRWRWYVELLNDTLRQYLAERGIEFDWDHQRFYFKPKNNKTTYVQWGSGTRRWVVRAPDPGKNGYWVHHAARLTIETLAEKLYVSIDPTMMFTTDGNAPVSRELSGPLAMRWSGKERNGAILRSILMWSDAITGGKRQAIIAAGDDKLIVSRLPMTVACPIGLADDHVKVGALLEFTSRELDPDAAVPPTFLQEMDEGGSGT